ncbi:SGNH/GDSL hydrolase family protein [Nonomuraea mesophila]|uniref:SGNH/GDSL hydrolase family protein n=1 Tax=Nonomuraea mesophila TaxID=2530382 RepID=A0A4R5F840_9ACTN|nr:GDSL-type esterase/lipase family protein [Nonomuraea mesophila]TDE44109.1 SGNH/GDSL hydrolase family protein [Nonomuraea mesophila]
MTYRPVTTWAAAAERLDDGGLRELTVRNIVRTTVGGSGLRVRLTNAFGNRPVTFGHVRVGVPLAGAALAPGSNRRLTFGGSPEVTVAPGATALSDPLPVRVRPRHRLAISLYVRGKPGTLTGRNRATAPAYPPPGSSLERPPCADREPATAPAYRSVPGDHAADEGSGAFTEEVAVWHWMDALTVTAPAPVSAVAVLGDSIATGVGSETGHGWVDLLADVLGGSAVVNEGVSGGRVLAAGTGRPAEARLTAEVLTKPGIATVILLAGLNDLGAGARAHDLIAAYARIAATARAAGVRVIGGTLTPYAGAEYHTEQGERARQEVNAHIRSEGAFDGVADFDAALRDPADPARLLPRYDCGDHLHPSTAGHQALAAEAEAPLNTRPDDPEVARSPSAPWGHNSV